MAFLLALPYPLPPLLLHLRLQLLLQPQQLGHPRHRPQDRLHLLVLVLQLEEEGHHLLLLQVLATIRVRITAFLGFDEFKHYNLLQDKV